MSESDGRAPCEPSRYFEPGHEPGRCGRGAVFCLEFHDAFSGAKAQPGQCVDDGAQAVNSAQVVLPCIGLVAIQAVQEDAPIGAAQHGLHFLCQCQRLLKVPLGQHARMHHQPPLHVQGHGACAQPVEQGAAVWGLQDVVERVAAVRLAHAVRHGQQMQVVVAQQAVSGALQLDQTTQDGQ